VTGTGLIIDGNRNGIRASRDGIDLYTAKKPKLKSSTCSRSRMCERTAALDCIEQSETWGVCTDDQLVAEKADVCGRLRMECAERGWRCVEPIRSRE
jgi:hypothetical protein